MKDLECETSDVGGDSVVVDHEHLVGLPNKGKQQEDCDPDDHCSQHCCSKHCPHGE